MADINVNVNAEPAEATQANVNNEPTAEPAKPAEPEAKPVEKEEKPEAKESTPKSASKSRKTKADLQAQIDMLQAELNNVVDNSADFNEQLGAKDTEITNLKQEVENYKAQVAALSKAVDSIIEDKKNKLPDNMKNLVPENQDAISTLNWLLKAEGNAPVEKPEVQIGRVIPVDRTQVNNPENSDMSPYEKMTSAFAQLFSKK